MVKAIGQVFHADFMRRVQIGMEGPMADTNFTQRDGVAVTTVKDGDGDHSALKSPALTVVMPGSAEQNAMEIKAISPEGLPADPKAGPGALYGFLALCVVFLSVASLVAVPWIGWPGAAMALGFGVIALFFNPEMVATLNRAGERRHVLENRKHDHDHGAT